MLKNYLKPLKLKSKKFARSHKIFDIVLYGSAVRGKIEPRDLDFLLIFEKELLKKRLTLAREFKEMLKVDFRKADVKTANLDEFFDKSFLARQGILVEGISLLYNETLSERFGFRSYALFSYNLKNLTHNEKTKFTYALIGRNSFGMIKQLRAEPLGKGAVLIPIENSLIFEDFLKKWNLNYKMKKIMRSLI